MGIRGYTARSLKFRLVFMYKISMSHHLCFVLFFISNRNISRHMTLSQGRNYF